MLKQTNKILEKNKTNFLVLQEIVIDKTEDLIKKPY